MNTHGAGRPAPIRILRVCAFSHAAIEAEARGAERAYASPQPPRAFF